MFFEAKCAEEQSVLRSNLLRCKMLQIDIVCLEQSFLGSKVCISHSFDNSRAIEKLTFDSRSRVSIANH